MKKIIVLILVLFLNNAFSSDFTLTLNKFVRIVANANNVNFVISDSVNKDFKIYLPNFDISNKKLTLNLLKNVLAVNDLSYKVVSNVYLIYKKKIVTKKKKEKIKSFVFKYNFLTSNDIVSFFRLYPNVKHTVLKDRIIFFTTLKKSVFILKQLKQLDTSFLSCKVNVTVISTDNNKAKDVGTDFKALKFNASYYISLITSNVNITQRLNNPTQFYTFLNFLHTKGISNLIFTPTVNLTDRQKTVLESTTQIPFLVTTVTNKESQTIVQNSYKYNNIGLKLYFKKVHVYKNRVEFDLDISIQNILDKSLTPTITTKRVTSHISLKYKQIFLLAGLNSNEAYNSTFSIPIVENIPFLGYLTTHKKIEHKNTTFSIIITPEKLYRGGDA